MHVRIPVVVTGVLCNRAQISDGRRQSYPHRSLVLLCLILYHLFSFRQLLTSRNSATRGLSVSQPELSNSVTKQSDSSFQWSVQSSTIALDQSAGEKSPSHCKKLIVTNYFIILAKESCNKTFRFRTAVARSAVLQISATPIRITFRCLVNIQGLWIVFRYYLAGTKTSEEL